MLKITVPEATLVDVELWWTWELITYIESIKRNKSEKDISIIEWEWTTTYEFRNWINSLTPSLVEYILSLGGIIENYKCMIKVPDLNATIPEWLPKAWELFSSLANENFSFTEIDWVNYIWGNAFSGGTELNWEEVVILINAGYEILNSYEFKILNSENEEN